ncbi:hypothetical protein [Aurantimonas sp. Leaf443]|uniref:amino acid kinase family protein n=1 Tax=Aurantimonas sp. Leaf443 TaxID=1736378 RepID=UPI000701F056|nr:hypothetical protein [Aurantimonas sp. Leaf443]KQT85362.1 hypothetical protein ASG48_08970 [Aurantimonas sp. Leaf443]
MQNLTVLKLGGSFAVSPELPRWIAAIELSAAPLVVVPGGGPFADAVRRAQARMGFDDDTAHVMAIHAMEQYGRAIVALGTRLVETRDAQEMEAATGRGAIAVWMPSTMALSDPDIARDWSVTSDSLAAWLAGRLQASRLVVMKQIDVPAGTVLDALVRAQIVDPAFPDHLDPGTALHLCGPSELPRAGALLARGEAPGVRVACHGQALVAAQ